MYSESAAEDLLGSTKQNDDKKVTQRLLPSVIASCSQVAMQSRPKTGKPAVVLLVFLCNRYLCILWYNGKGIYYPQFKTLLLHNYIYCEPRQTVDTRNISGTELIVMQGKNQSVVGKLQEAQALFASIYLLNLSPGRPFI